MFDDIGGVCLFAQVVTDVLPDDTVMPFSDDDARIDDDMSVSVLRPITIKSGAIEL
jgi:hypothetical protein